MDNTFSILILSNSKNQKKNLKGEFQKIGNNSPKSKLLC